MIDKKYFMLCEKITEKEIEKFDINWKSNIKFDGERIIAVINKGEVFLINRGGKFKNLNFIEVAEELKSLPNCILDGEIISHDDKFAKLMKRSLTTNKYKLDLIRKEIPIKFMVFDILSLNNKSLENKSLKERIEVLKEVCCLNNNLIEVVKYGDIKETLENAKKENREGIIIKNMNSFYSHKRSDNWLKLKFFKEEVMRVISYKENFSGIRAETENKNGIQIAGFQSKNIKEHIDKEGYCDIVVQYLEKTENNKYRFISYKEIFNESLI